MRSNATAQAEERELHAHDIGVGSVMHVEVDGNVYEIDLASLSKRLARASQQQRENVVISPAGYGLHWPEVDEDMSIDGLIGVRHVSPLSSSA